MGKSFKFFGSMNRLLKWSIILSAIAIAGVLFVRFLFYQGIVQMNYPDEEIYPLKGIDISNHQKRINWEELRSEKLSFIIIKATEGIDHRDSLFSYYYSNSKKEGYATGGYHFFRLCSGGTEQAQNFINTVPKDSTDLPPTIDFEFGANCDTTGMVREKVVIEIQKCLDALEAHYKKKPMIYVTRGFYNRFMVKNFKEYPLWIRNIYKYPVLKENRVWAIWQYANRGHVNGIDGFVDLNVINGQSLKVLEEPVKNDVSQP